MGLLISKTLIAEHIAAKTISVDQGIVIKDQDTGDIYCVTIASGRVVKGQKATADRQSIRMIHRQRLIRSRQARSLSPQNDAACVCNIDSAGDRRNQRADEPHDKNVGA